VPNISEQVAGCWAGPDPPKPDQLYVVWAGANDFFIANLTDPSIPAMNISIATLAAAGEKQLLVPHLPPLESTPAGSGVVTPVSSIFTPSPGPHRITQFNAEFNTQLDNLESTLVALDVTVDRLDTFSLIHQAGSSPGSFGLTSVTDPAFDTVATAPNPDTYIFWDVAHPTAVAHGILGEIRPSLLSRNPPVWLFARLPCWLWSGRTEGNAPQPSVTLKA